LDAVWVDVESEQRLLVVEGVDVQADPVVGPDIVTLSDGRLDGTRVGS